MSNLILPCVCCQGLSFDEIAAYPALGRVTSDCRPFAAGGRLCVCRRCGFVQKPTDEGWKAEIAQIYAAYDVYGQSAGAEQKNFDMRGLGRARSLKIAEFLSSRSDWPQRGQILDVGCGNGAFLQALATTHPDWTLSGLELDQREEAKLHAIPGFRQLHIGHLAKIEAYFDCVSFIHALEHFASPMEVLSQAKERLAPGGQLLIQIPDLAANPFDVLIVDHAIHVTADTLTGLLRQAGFVPTWIGSVIEKELTVLARPLQKAPDKIVPRQPTRAVETHIQWLVQVFDQASAIKGPLALFGTSIAASWLYGMLSDRVVAFVDEDTARTGRSHLGLPILLPADVPPEVTVYIPLVPAVARGVSARLQGVIRGVVPPLFAESANAP